MDLVAALRDAATGDARLGVHALALLLGVLAFLLSLDMLALMLSLVSLAVLAPALLLGVLAFAHSLSVIALGFCPPLDFFSLSASDRTRLLSDQTRLPVALGFRSPSASPFRRLPISLGL